MFIFYCLFLPWELAIVVILVWGAFRIFKVTRPQTQHFSQWLFISFIINFTHWTDYAELNSLNCSTDWTQLSWAQLTELLNRLNSTLLSSTHWTAQQTELNSPELNSADLIYIIECYRYTVGTWRATIY